MSIYDHPLTATETLTQSMIEAAARVLCESLNVPFDAPAMRLCAKRIARTMIVNYDQGIRTSSVFDRPDPESYDSYHGQP